MKRNSMDLLVLIQRYAFVFTLPLSTLIGSHAVSEIEFAALLQVQSQLFGEKKIEVEDFVLFSKQCYLNFFNREDGQFPSTSLTFGQINDLIDRLLSPLPEPKFGMVNTPPSDSVQPHIPPSPAVQMPAFPTIINFLNPASAPEPGILLILISVAVESKLILKKKAKNTKAASVVPLAEEAQNFESVETAPAAESSQPKKKRFRKPKSQVNLKPVEV
jgi:hypothetical protein